MDSVRHNLNAAAKSNSRAFGTMLDVTAKVSWALPGSFTLAKALGSSYGLRCILFHNIAEQDTQFTRGIGVNTTRREFEWKLQFVVKHYNPVSLEQVLVAGHDGKLPDRPILVTFDDAYASIAEIAAPLCAKYGVPAVFFVNASFIDNQRLMADNLICFVASECGMTAVAEAARAIKGADYEVPTSIKQVFGQFLPNLTLSEREAFVEELARRGRVDQGKLAQKTKLYLTSQQLRELARYNIEIGNHTSSHVHCRRLSVEEMEREIAQNREALESISGTRVRSFSIPYGSSADLTDAVVRHVGDSGHQSVFLSQSVANSKDAGLFRLDRVSTHAVNDATFFQEIELLPRMRALRDRWFTKNKGNASANSEMVQSRERAIEPAMTMSDVVVSKNSDSRVVPSARS